jgi:hypothetical protein
MIKAIESKEANAKFVIESYNSSMDVVRDCKTRTITSDSFDNMQDGKLGGHGKEFCGVDSYEQALQFLEEGYQPTVDKLKVGIKANLQGNGKRISFHNDIVGYAPIVPLAILGVPQAMINSKMKPIKAKVVDVYYNISASWRTKSEDIIKAGTKLLSAVIALEQQGYRFNIYAVQSYFGNGKCYMLKVKVKSSEQPIDLKRISFPLTHTGFFRVIGFDWYSKCPEAKHLSGYGRSLDTEYGNNKKMQKIAKDLFGENAVWFGSTKIINESEEYIKEVLSNAKKVSD